VNGPTRAAAELCPAPAIFSRKNGVKAFFPLRRGMGAQLSVDAYCPARQKDGERGGFMRFQETAVIHG